jgi:hypothetical protein
VELHPYLAIILLIACRYGTSAGLGAAAASLFTYVLLGYTLLGNISFIVTWPHANIIVGFVVMALIAGAFSDFWSGKADEQARRAAEATEKLKVLKTQNEVLEAANREMRSRIMGETETIGSLYEMAQKLTTLEERFLYPAVLDLVAQYVGAHKCSFYLLEGDSLKLVAQKGWADVPESAQRVNVIAGKSIMAKVVKDRQLHSLKDLAYQEEELEAGDKVICAPLKSPVDGRILGTIAVEKIPFKSFNAHALKTFSIIADWASRALTNVTIFSQLEEKVAAEEKVGQSVFESLRQRHVPRKAFDYLLSLEERIVPPLINLLQAFQDEPHVRTNILDLLSRVQERKIAFDIRQVHEFIKKSLEFSFRIYFEKFSMEVLMDDPRPGELIRVFLTEQYRDSLNALYLALGIIHRASNPGTHQRIHHLFRSKSEQDRIQALSYVGRFIDSDLYLLAEALMRDDYKEIFDVGQRMFGFRKLLLDDIIGSYLTSRNRWLLAFTIYCIGNAGMDQYMWEVFANTKSEDPYVREASLRALGKLRPDLGNGQILEAFERALKDGDRTIRDAAFCALREIDDKRGLALLQGLADEICI